jgi:hypothetical protein
MKHAGPPVKSNLAMLTGPRRLKSNNFIFKAMLGPGGARRSNQIIGVGRQEVHFVRLREIDLAKNIPGLAGISGSAPGAAVMSILSLPIRRYLRC